MVLLNTYSYVSNWTDSKLSVKFHDNSQFFWVYKNQVCLPVIFIKDNPFTAHWRASQPDLVWPITCLN